MSVTRNASRVTRGLLAMLALPLAIAAQGTNPVTTPPKAGKLNPLKLPPINTRTLPNGMKLWVVEQHELPLADFILVVNSGSETDPADKPGLAAVTGDMLDEGTTTRSA